MRSLGLWATGFLAFAWSGTALAQQAYFFGGEVALTGRVFVQDGLYDGQTQAGLSPILSGRLEFTAPLDDGRLVLEAFGQWDERTHATRFDLPKAFYEHEFESFDLLVGSNIEFWGVSEGDRVVDVINQEDILDAPNKRKRLGQPMVNLNIDVGTRGTLGLWALTGFRERDFGSEEARFRAPFETDEGAARFEEGNGRHLDFAARYASSARLRGSSVDFALSYFNGTDRDPSQVLTCRGPGGPIDAATCDAINASADPFSSSSGGSDTSDLFDRFGGDLTDDLVAEVSSLSNLVLVPHYQHIQQVGGEFALTTGSLQLTFEGALRFATGETSFSGIAGGQYTLDGLFGTDAQLLLIGEYLYDNRSARQPLNYFENDVFLGFNYARNDIAGTQISGGFYVDTESAAQIYALSVGRRLTDSLKIDVSALFINADGYDDPLSLIENDGYVEVSFSWFF